ncbi:MAG TPA: hypothetical protein VNA04_14920 [Thermoanaerobaculia bacterium]|nr:hypothetical protein [Thermoanaerobaculia bacterium]
MKLFVWLAVVSLFLVLAPAAEACIPDPQTLCLNNNRFQVRVNWAVQSQGTSGQGQATLIRNAQGQVVDDSGLFWFFNQDNMELVIKVLDGCGVNNRFWVFAGGLTNVDVTLTVTDTHTPTFQSVTYRHTEGPAFPPIQDTGAFATCP